MRRATITFRGFDPGLVEVPPASGNRNGWMSFSDSVMNAVNGFYKSVKTRALAPAPLRPGQGATAHSFTLYGTAAQLTR